MNLLSFGRRSQLQGEKSTWETQFRGFNCLCDKEESPIPSEQKDAVLHPPIWQLFLNYVNKKEIKIWWIK